MGYSDIACKLFDAPRNAGCLEQSNDVVIGKAGHRAAGAEVQFSLRIAGSVVTEARFLAYGCPHTIAAASRVACELEGADVSRLEDFDPHRLAAELGVPAEKLGRMLIIEDAVAVCRNAITGAVRRET